MTGDGCVGFADVLTVLARWDDAGESGLDGDADCDGVVGFVDVLLVLATWGAGCP